MSSPAAPENLSRRQQFARTYTMARKTDRWLWLWILLAFLVLGAVGFALFFFLPGPSLLFAVPGALIFGVFGALIVFGRRAQRAAYAQMEGRTGAAAAALNTLRRGWKVDAAVGFTRQQDVVHRVVGRPGIVLVGEGNSARLKQLLANERRRHTRVVSDVPIHEIVCGNEAGQVPLPKLVRHVSKLKRAVKPAELTDVIGRLRALDAQRPNVPLPKGPLPTSMKGLRGQMRGGNVRGR